MCLPVTPYKVEKEWVHAGLKCAVVQAGELQHRCGYVRVPPTHSLHGKDYYTPNIEVHGGLTYAKEESCVEEDGKGWWFGFDCAHCDDASYDPSINSANCPPDLVDGLRIREMYPIRGEHFWTLSEVVAETDRLAEQLAVA